MKRFQIYRLGASDEDSLVILDFSTVPEDSLVRATEQAHDMAFSAAKGEAESLEEVYEQHPHLCAFEPWIWKLPGGWNPQGLNRERLVMGQKINAKAELSEFLRTFIDAYRRYVSADEMREVLDQTLREADHS